MLELGSRGSRDLHTRVQSGAGMWVGRGEREAVLGGPPVAPMHWAVGCRPAMGTHHPETPCPRREVAGQGGSDLAAARHPGRQQGWPSWVFPNLPIPLSHPALIPPKTTLTWCWEQNGAEAVPPSRPPTARPPPVRRLHRIQGLGEGKMREAPNLPHDCRID